MSRRTPRPAGPLRRTVETLRPQLNGNRALMAGGLAALLLEVALRVLEPWPIKFAVDAVSARLGADLGAAGGAPQASVGLLLGCGIGLLGLAVLRALAGYLSTVAFAIAGSRVATALRARVFAHVQALSVRHHAGTALGDTVQRLVADIGRVQEVAVTAGLPLVGNVLTLVVLTVVMALLDPILAVVVLASCGVYLLFARRSSREITLSSRATRRGEGALASTASESIAAIGVVQSFGLESTVAGRFTAGNVQALTEGVKAKRLSAALERRTDVLVGVSTAVVLTVGAIQVMRGSMTPGDLVIFLMYLKIALKPLKDLAKYQGRIARAAASGERVADLLDEDPEIVDKNPEGHMPSVAGRIELDGVRVRDGRGALVFDALSLTIPAGQTVAVVGPSGAGKSTLAALLSRLQDPESGRILLDGRPLDDLPLRGVRGSIAVVHQEAVLFHGSILENIRHGRLDASDEEVASAARAAEADGFIRALPDGYLTEIGERGATLSGGQRQRIAIARALLRDAPIVVLDEATTGLDPQSRTLVRAALRRLGAGRTTLAITHDAEQLAGADRVIWLADGDVQEDGTPAELAADPGSRLAGWLRAHAAETGADAGDRDDTTEEVATR
ncbi:ABC transporter ATP-binding protein [Mycetocola reblochoni]|uniref:ABC transporter, transmembrane region n=2 Tax=Mycetocola reblochoni TaxID=331618 RepID=A0A1R4K924_9MICO|nr:ABC transporter ATP-binding protein [Mycetocola reblochoni]RLP68085.1 ABC transporter ATP-binding protein [Mycetocola reblochoni]SJN40645.1 ABC transporter, transmembrane region [Mycetocola reblochoni REB411]